MAISVFELFKVGIGPSSSHTVGPMKAALTFVQELDKEGQLQQVQRLTAELFGSLGATGAGHGSGKAVILGLQGDSPESVVVDSIAQRVADVREGGRISLLAKHEISFTYAEDLLMHRNKSLPFHSNGMTFTAYDAAGTVLSQRCFYSVGGGFVVDESAAEQGFIIEDDTPVPYPFSTGAELLQRCAESGLSISALMMENEKAWRSEAEINESLLTIWQVMNDCIEKGCRTEGIMPGGLKVKRRAAHLYRQLKTCNMADDPLNVMDWVGLYALAVNEENASGGRIVTAPTNGAAGIIPAVLRYYLDFSPGASLADAPRFLLTAAAIGILYKINASISGAEVGCQGEVGSACSMAAAALADALGGTPEQVENAAEIGMEHNLGLTCDPIGGLVQVPCIERNAMAAVKAITAARMALRGDGHHFVSLDQVIKTMRDTGRDMQDKYKETARGGLAVNVLAVPVSIIEC
ncbi:L-serine ammonia-lyase [Dasania sp. GY-MA-18]|uniref:L-serine dehydratase n=1 Tax=Dasania phycosphaerae TaxID=2950436 RepID=A0A9J6RRW5_9GAMM|nr:MULTISPECIES: L-serine ammonia-lyase [Dasania]MCR8924431.1 L-serine ammonia-lyase [Dasania sp. GY-MA-18]MCZ0867106.1 L-serine ammonia-lyase [Dasania phycosphaerae]MCZ0870558.1 L-serine ammonia-lyase [Dasania phycosphaerae]